MGQPSARKTQLRQHSTACNASAACLAKLLQAVEHLAAQLGGTHRLPTLWRLIACRHTTGIPPMLLP